ncbi:hypothetical protein VE03_06039 [Pseudogymnoascus sp. 23342-1-I1]|nr:hypothetical protein VE03_06039 [Pseudogymnoascus sp. 23342-1-I1]
MIQPRGNGHRDDSSGLWNGLKTWYTFLLQAIVTLALGAGVIYFVDGRGFQTGSPPLLYHGKTLYQTDVSYIISAVLVLVKLSSSACLSLISWRIIYILLEGGGLTLREIRHNLGLLNISGPAGTITRPLIGNTALLKDTPWEPRSSKQDDHEVFSYRLPNATVFNGEKFVAVLVARPTDDKSEVYTCPAESPAFGLLPNVTFTSISYFMGDNPFAVSCYAIARIKLRAGSYVSPSTRASAVGIAETVFDTPNTKELIEDPLVDEIFAAMPDVMANMAAINTINAQMLGNLDGYVCGMLMLSYQETWNAMTVKFERRSSISKFHPPREIVRARVSKISLLDWLAANLCVVLAGVLLYALQMTVDGKPVRDKTIAALTMDLTPLMDRIPDWGDAAVLGKQEKELGKLRFRGVGVRRQVVEVNDYGDLGMFGLESKVYVLVEKSDDEEHEN